jgi:hypothetical protein
MLAHVDKNNPPFNSTNPSAPNYIPVAQAERHGREIFEGLAKLGITLVGADGQDFVFSLAPTAREHVYQVLEDLHVVSVTLEPADIIPLGGANAFSQGVARGLQARVPALLELLSGIRPEEIFSALDSAIAFVVNDRPAPSGNAANDAWLRDHYARGAEADLLACGLLDGHEIDPWQQHDARQAAQDADPAEIPEAFRAEPRAYRSPFGTDGGW